MDTRVSRKVDKAVKTKAPPTPAAPINCTISIIIMWIQLIPVPEAHPATVDLFHIITMSISS